MSNNDDVVRKVLNGSGAPIGPELAKAATAPQQMPAPQQMLQQICVPALEQARQYLAQVTGKQYLPAAIFVPVDGSDQNVVLSGLPIDKLYEAIVHEMKKHNLPIPHVGDGPNPETVHALHNVALVAAIRRALPFITGPGAETARKLLVEATQPLKDDGPEQTVARVVAGLLSTLPGMEHREVPEVGDTLIAAHRGECRVTVSRVLSPRERVN